MTIKNNGNVGIGTTTPSVKLEVDGAIKATSIDGGTMTGTVQGRNVSNGPFGETGGGQYGFPARLSIGYGIGSTPITIGQTGDLSVSGNVGIGTAAPGVKLDISGDANVSTRFKMAGNSILYLPSNNPERGPWNPIWNAIGSGKSLFNDEEFSSGTNSVSVYNNSGGSAVTITRQTGQTGVPNSPGVWLKVSYDGIGPTSPNFGGVVQNFTPAASRTYAQRFRAKVPAGKTLNINENSQGTNNTSYWLTNNAGTGKWEDYVRVSHAGNTGTFSSGGHISISGGSGAFDWYIASMNVYEVNTPITAGSNTWTKSQTFSGGANFSSGIWNASGNVGIGTTPPATHRMCNS